MKSEKLTEKERLILDYMERERPTSFNSVHASKAIPNLTERGWYVIMANLERKNKAYREYKVTDAGYTYFVGYYLPK